MALMNLSFLTNERVNKEITFQIWLTWKFPKPLEDTPATDLHLDAVPGLPTKRDPEALRSGINDSGRSGGPCFYDPS